MILAVHSDARYCNEKKSRSQVGGHYFLSNDDEFPPNNGAILTVATVTKEVMSLAAEADSRAGSSVFKHKRGGIFTTNTHSDGPPTTTNPNPNQQLDSGGSNSPHNPTQTNKSNRHALS